MDLMTDVSFMDVVKLVAPHVMKAQLTFPIGGGMELRVEISIDEKNASSGQQAFKINIQRSDGYGLIISPGHLTASQDGKTWEAETVSTSDSLAKWLGAAPLTGKNLSEGLSKLTAQTVLAKNAIQQIQSNLSALGFPSFAIIPDLCWLNADYDKIKLGDVVLTKFKGRICFRDIAFNLRSIYFRVELAGECEKWESSLGNETSLTLEKKDTEEIEIEVGFSAFIDRTAKLVRGKVFGTHVKAPRGEINQRDHDDPLSVDFSEGALVSLEDVSIRYNWSLVKPTIIVAGTCAIWSPKVEVKKNAFYLGDDVSVKPQKLTLYDLEAKLTLETDPHEGKDLIRGILTAPYSEINATYVSVPLQLQEVSGSISLNSIAFGPHHIHGHVEMVGAEVQKTAVSLGDSDMLTFEKASLNLLATLTDGHSNPNTGTSLVYLNKFRLSSESGKLIMKGTVPVEVTFSEGTDAVLDNVFASRVSSGGAPGAVMNLHGVGRVRVGKAEIVDHTFLLDQPTGGPSARKLVAQNVEASDLLLDLEFAHSTASSVRGTFKAAKIQVVADYITPELTLTGFDGSLILNHGSFGPEFQEIRFEMVGASVQEAMFANLADTTPPLPADALCAPQGQSTLDNLKLKNAFLSILADYKRETLTGTTLVHADDLSMTAVEGYAEARVNVFGPAPASVKFALKGVGLAVHDFLQVSGGTVPTPPVIAPWVEARIDEAITDPPASSIVIQQWFELTQHSFDEMRKSDAAGQQIVPEEVITEFETKLKGKGFDSCEKLAKRLQQLLTPDEFNNHGTSIVRQAERTDAVMSNVKLEFDDLIVEGKLLSRGFHGTVGIPSARLSFSQIEGLKLPNIQNLTGVRPIDPADQYEVLNLIIEIPGGKLNSGIVGISQSFDTADVILDDVEIKISSPETANRLRVNVWGDRPSWDGIVGQLSVPKAELITPAVPSTPLGDIQIDIYRREYGKILRPGLRTLEEQLLARLSLVAVIDRFMLQEGKEYRFNLFSDFFEGLGKLFESAGDVLPGTIQGMLLDAVGKATEYLPIVDIGVQFHTADVFVSLDVDRCDMSHIAIKVECGLTNIRPFFTYEYPYCEKDDDAIIPWPKCGVRRSDPKLVPKEWAGSMQFDIVVRFGYRMDSVTHRIVLSEAPDFYIFPRNASPPVRLAIEAIQEWLFEMVGLNAIKEWAFRRFGDTASVPLPESWDVRTFRLMFEKDKEDDNKAVMRFSAEASQNKWNPLT